ncbi:MAG: hypothetical protein P1U38_03420 [Aeromicrobium sp.]|uniref:hypothetical protein n=1 Tax=Aeromicrobium sp. TaxID=1871063 RepID=UPI0025C2655E|nr:hypothetical protein [Aeromicrobium sp.]MCK5890156.1 hypothetical protein [Aeromicrobium sp.]MDF1703799.1 hypothetical protein [Aeromicrobium sp.]
MTASQPEPDDPRDRRGPSDEALRRMAQSVARPLPLRLLWCLPIAVVGSVAFTFGVAVAGGTLTTTIVAIGFAAGLLVSLFSSFVARPRTLRIHGDGTPRT